MPQCTGDRAQCRRFDLVHGHMRRQPLSRRWPSYRSNPHADFDALPQGLIALRPSHNKYGRLTCSRFHSRRQGEWRHSTITTSLKGAASLLPAW